MKRPRGVCTHCGEKSFEWKHSMSKGLLHALRILYDHGRPAKLSDLESRLTATQYNNLQKLQYWHLANNDHNKKWNISTLGIQFLRGVFKIPKHVWTYKGKYVGMEDLFVYANDLDPHYRKIEHYISDKRIHANENQTTLF